MLKPQNLETLNCSIFFSLSLFLNGKVGFLTKFQRNAISTACSIDIFLCRIFVSVFRRWGCWYSGVRVAAASLMTQPSTPPPHPPPPTSFRPSWCRDEYRERGRYALGNWRDRDSKIKRGFLARRDDKIRYSHVMEWHFNYTNGRTKC